MTVAPPDGKKVDAKYHWSVWSISGYQTSLITHLWRI